MGAKANRAYIASVKETEWGVTPAAPVLQKINFLSDSLNFAIETTTPESIRDDRMISDVINVSAQNEGGYELEMQALASGPADEHLVAALWAEQWVGAASTVTDIVDGSIVAATRTLDLTATNSPPTLAIGDKISIRGSAVGNDGIYTIETAQGGDVYTLVEMPVADETFTTETWLTTGQYIKNGITEHSFTIERGHADVGEFFVFRGMAVNEFNLSFEAGAVVTGSYTFVGKDTQVDQTPIGNSYVNQPTTQFMSAGFNVKNVMLDGMPIESCLLESVEMSINNNLNAKLAVGAFYACDLSEGEFEVSGSIDLYFNDSTMYDKFVKSQDFSLSFQLSDNVGNAYMITLPRLKLSTGTVNVEGKNTDVMNAASYFAIYDPVEDCAVRIDRFIAS